MGFTMYVSINIFYIEKEGAEDGILRSTFMGNLGTIEITDYVYTYW